MATRLLHERFIHVTVGVRETHDVPEFVLAEFEVVLVAERQIEQREPHLFERITRDVELGVGIERRQRVGSFA